MNRRALAAAALLLAACSRDIQNTEAVRQAVMDYLRARTSETGLNVDLMQVDVTSVSFQRDQARASVYFRPKGVAEGGMQMNYTLDRQGNKWAVRGRTETGVNPHGAQSMPKLPPDHPATGDAPPSGALPPGHPPVSSNP